MIQKQTTTVRCAVYTRKSTDENLDLDFNSLDAQREAAENFVASQKHAGWVCLAERYDDGGFSGGTIDRPATRFRPYRDGARVRVERGPDGFLDRPNFHRYNR